MNGARAIPVRYRILGVLFVLSFVNYLLRNNLSVAIPSIQEEFSFTNAEHRLDSRQLQLQLHAAADSRRHLRPGLRPAPRADAASPCRGAC